MSEEQKFYIVRNHHGSVSILKVAPDPEKFKFLRMYPPTEVWEEWVSIHRYDEYARIYKKERESK